MRPSLLIVALVALAPPPVAAQAGTEVRLDSAAWRAMNVYFSNFAEARLPPFPRGKVDDATLARFGVMHHVANHSLWERIEPVPGRMGYGRLRAGHVDDAAEQYFGVRLGRHLSPPGDYPGTDGEYPEIEYAGGSYVFERADYPTFPFAQVRQFLDVGGGEFVADLGLYLSVDVGEDAHDTPVERLRRAGADVYDTGAIRARVRRVRDGSRERYVLLEWLPVPSGTEVRLDPEDWRALNVFFSNFAEAHVPPFRRGEVDDATLAHFAVMHHVLNDSRLIEAAPGLPGYRRLAARHVTATVATYFGRPVSHHETRAGEEDGLVQFADGYYVFPEGDYEARPFAQVGHLVDVGGEEFTADVGLYVLLEGSVDVYATPAEQLRRSGHEVGDAGAMRARIRRVREGGRDRYVLLEWLPAP